MKKVLTQNSFRNFSVFLTLIQFFFVICVKTEMWRWAIGCVWALKSALKTVLLSFLEGSSTELVMLTFFIGFILFEICRLSGEKFIQRLILKNYFKILISLLCRLVVRWIINKRPKQLGTNLPRMQWKATKPHKHQSILSSASFAWTASHHSRHRQTPNVDQLHEWRSWCVDLFQLRRWNSTES